MKTRLALAMVLAVVSIPALAEVGDIHTVKVDNAIVRENPDKASTQLDKLSSGAEVMEMDVQGEWYEIYVASTDVGGWMHVSMLELLGSGAPVVEKAPAPAAPVAKAKPVAKPAPSPAPVSTRLSIKSSGKKTPEMKKFEKYLVKYNARTSALKGYIPFTNAQDMGDGKLHVTVTNQWLDKSNARQKSSLITLYTRWKKASKASEPKVIAIDASGNEISQYPQ